MRRGAHLPLRRCRRHERGYRNTRFKAREREARGFPHQFLVPYKGVNHPGNHEPLIDLATWQRVQSILDTAKQARARKRTYDHCLKGSLFCGACGSRLQLDLPTNEQGIQYAYFSRSGRRNRKTRCTRRAIPVAVAEQLVADGYARISIDEAQYADIDRRIAHRRVREAAREPDLHDRHRHQRGGGSNPPPRGAVRRHDRRKHPCQGFDYV
ncbi:zinc ribbon domain-containing protein [Galbitalea sp. SE-J8]|uniref:zinc ribbon domain-containing protein n=1 Tax=Galbitalea sp. SE-J8 TaxID=3054952 RepID=UPI0033904E86